MFIWYNLPFLALVATAFLFLALQFVGGDSDSDVDIDHDIDFDSDIDIDGDVDGLHTLLGFLNNGRVPLSLLLMTLSFTWGAFGLIYNSVFKTLWQSYPVWAFAPVFLLSALTGIMSTRLSSNVLANVFKDTTSASRPEDLVGCVGTVISGGLPAAGEKGFGRARVYNEHGILLQIACVTHEDAEAPKKHIPIFVTGYDENTRRYSVLTYDSPDFHGYLSGHTQEMKSFDERLQRSREHQIKAENT